MIKSPLLRKLQPYTKNEIKLLNAFSTYLSLHNIVSPTKDISIQLKEYLDTEVEVKIGNVKKSTFKEYKDFLPKSSILGIIGVYPLDKKVLVEIDRELAEIIINKLLDTSENDYTLRIGRLTEIEEVMLEYVLLKILATFHKYLDKLELRLERLITFNEDLPSNDKDIIQIMINISIVHKIYFIRLSIPCELIREALRESQKEAITSIFNAKLSLLEEITTTVKAMVGRVDISKNDLLGLEVGDVILLDEKLVQVSEEGLKGNVILQIGQSKTDRLKGEIMLDEDEILKIKITQV